MHVPEMFSDQLMFMFLYALMEVAASVPNIVCIAQITFAGWSVKAFLLWLLDEQNSQEYFPPKWADSNATVYMVIWLGSYG